MENIRLHPRTKEQLELLLKKMPQVIILSGQKGVGLSSAAQALARNTTSKHNVITIAPTETGSIKIDTVRQLYDHTRTKTADRLVIIIDDADTMLARAQNALLKLLEDTPKHVGFLLTSHNPQLLLATIRSRSQEITLLPLSEQPTSSLLDNLGIKDKTTRSQLLFLAEGLPAELTRLVGDKEYQTKRFVEIREARDFLYASLYQKLVIAHRLSSDRGAALALLRDAMHIVGNTLKKQPSSGLANILKNLLDSEQKLLDDGHVRTQLLALAVKLS